MQEFFFFHWPVVQAIFLGLCLHFLATRVALYFFTVKALQEIFFSNLPPPPPPPHLKYQMVHPLETSSVLCTSTWDFVLKGRISSFIEVPQQLRHIMQISGFYSREHRETACFEVNIHLYYLWPPSWISPAWDHEA